MIEALTSNATLNTPELFSVESLTNYVAVEKQQTKAAIDAEVAKQFGASKLSNIRNQDYDKVIQYLVEFYLEETRN